MSRYLVEENLNNSDNTDNSANMEKGAERLRRQAPPPQFDWSRIKPVRPVTI